MHILSGIALQIVLTYTRCDLRFIPRYGYVLHMYGSSLFLIRLNLSIHQAACKLILEPMGSFVKKPDTLTISKELKTYIPLFSLYC